ncbi:MAG: lysophospholipid acyltransferase family protein [Verrucomicrobiota bacterium]
MIKLFNQAARHRFNYFLTRCSLRLILPLFVRMHRIEFATLAEGPLLLAGNHISHFDPPCLCLAFSKKVDFMAMKELFMHPLARAYFLGNDVFAVDRYKADSTALRESVRRLKDKDSKRIVCMFPEGGLRAGHESVLEGKALPSGCGAVASLAQCPVQPFIIVGTDQLYRWQNIFKRPHVYIVLGKVIYLDKHVNSKSARQKVDADVQRALRELYAKLLEEYKLPQEVLPQTAQQRWGLEPLPETPERSYLKKSSSS